MCSHDNLLNVLDEVDSTNNYAMQKVYAGMAKHGEAYFSAFQTAGKGQRGKHWLGKEGKNIALSIVIIPQLLTIAGQFYLSAAVSLGCHDFLVKYAGNDISIKWPNDIYWRDRKAGGILIENVLNGTDWKWAVIGVGINVNQDSFSAKLQNPISMTQITGKEYDLVKLANDLHQKIIVRVDALIAEKKRLKFIKEYNQNLFKLNKMVRLKKGNMIFETQIKGVSSNGQLITSDAFEKHYHFGEVEWLL